MEGMEAATSAATSAAPAPAAAPAAAPPAPAPAPAAPASAPASSGGGAMGSIKDAFASLNWIEVGMGALGVAALFSLINYYRWQKATGQSLITETQNKIDDLAIKVADLQSATQRDELLGNQSFDGMFS